MSSRRLGVLIRHLPPDSATMRTLHGEAADWRLTDHLLAATVDHLAIANWMFATVNRAEDTEPEPYPTPVPRPGPGLPLESADATEPPQPTSATAAEIAAFFR